MKFACALTVLFASSAAFSAQPGTFKCGDYLLTVTDSVGHARLTNTLANSSADLQLQSPASAFSRKILYSATMIPVEINVLSRVIVTAEAKLLEGAASGKLSVTSAADPAASSIYTCSKN